MFTVTVKYIVVRLEKFSEFIDVSEVIRSWAEENVHCLPLLSAS